MEDPRRSAREAQPRWQPHPPPLIRIEPDDEAESPSAFSLWNVPGCKSLFHDGRHIRVSARQAAGTFHFAFNAKLSEGDPFAFLISPAACRQENWRAISRFNEAISTGSPRFGESTPERPSRATLNHMHALQALDATLAGASHRQIAAAIFGEEVVATRWQPDSELRARVRHLIRRARELMQGGYRRLLDFPLSGQGD